jgi:hypothetical protein
LLFALIGSLVLWFLAWGLFMAISRMAGKSADADEAWSGRLFLLLVSLVLFSLYSTIALPARIAVFDQKRQEMRITDHSALLMFWQSPIKAGSQTIPFDQITGFRFRHFQESIMGTSHEEMELLAITSEDTLAIGYKLVYHGEFGFLTDWRPVDTIVAEAKQDAQKVALRLEDIVGLEP